MPENLILALFDIDGTLLSSGAGARESLSQAIEEIAEESFKIEPGDCAGKTDPLIIVNFLEKAGCLPQELQWLLERIKERYLVLLESNYNKDNDAFLYPGIPEMLEKLGEYMHVFPALLTGNFELGARIKLEPFHLNPLFPVGAFGEDGFMRTDLSQIAVNRSETYYKKKFHHKNIVVIGDTVDDVACGKVLGARTVNICRRKSNLENLKLVKPDYIFEGSEDHNELVSAILG